MKTIALTAVLAFLACTLAWGTAQLIGRAIDNVHAQACATASQAGAPCDP